MRLSISGYHVIKNALSGKEDINAAFVFGSLARYGGKATSDVDIMIIDEMGLRKLSGLLMDVASQIGREINPHVFSEKEFIIKSLVFRR